MENNGKKWRIVKQIISSVASGEWEPCGRHPESCRDCQHCQRGINHKMKQSFSEVMTPGMMKGLANTAEEPRLRRILMEIMARCLHKQAAKKSPTICGSSPNSFPPHEINVDVLFAFAFKSPVCFFLSMNSTRADSNAKRALVTRARAIARFFFFCLLFCSTWPFAWHAAFHMLPGCGVKLDGNLSR